MQIMNNDKTIKIDHKQNQRNNDSQKQSLYILIKYKDKDI